ncbi:S9 family peptidase [Streptomyces sp. NPDC021093]|uniref:S9 family peptidase n=1 Tax=Streptomyces sp. NPDC021093 TaxID=3365112 RepID=UPI00378B8690
MKITRWAQSHAAEAQLRLELTDSRRFRTAEQVALSPCGSRVAIVVRRADESADRWTSTLTVQSVTEREDEGEGEGASEPEVVAPAGADAPCWSPDGRWLAHLGREAGRPGTSLLLWSATEHSVRSLAGGLKAVSHLMWSPDGTELAFVAAAEDETETGSTRNGSPRVIKDLGYKIDGVGLVPEARRHLHVVRPDTSGGSSRGASEVRQLTHGSFDVHAPAWSPDGETISLGVSRPADREAWPLADVYALHRATGDLRPVSDWGGTVVWTGWTPDGRVVFAGQPTPGPCRRASLYRVDDRGKDPVDLLAGFDRRLVASARGVTPAVLFLDAEQLLFCARDAGRTWVYSVPLTGGEATPWFAADSAVVQGMSASAGAGALALVVSDAHTAGDVYLTVPGSSEHRRITHLNRWAERIPVTVAEEIRFDYPDRTDQADRTDRTDRADRAYLHGYLLRGRPDGTAGPTLFDIHSGPDYAWRPLFSPRHLYHQVLADRGWNVLLLNPRGSDGYGTDFMRSVVGRLGFSEEEDFLLALDCMVRDGQATEGRVAVMGSSHGGFMTNWLTARTDRFAAGISVAGVSNWLSLYGTSSLGATTGPALLGGTPRELPESYVNSSPLTYVSQVRAPTLLLHGENDLMNPIGQSEEWFTALRSEGCPVELVRYPGGGHLFMHNGPLSHQEDYARRIVRWLTEHVEGRNESGGQGVRR